jgi:hypothetical protein
MTHAVLVIANGCIIKKKANKLLYYTQQQDKTPLIIKTSADDTRRDLTFNHITQRSVETFCGNVQR